MLVLPSKFDDLDIRDISVEELDAIQIPAVRRAIDDLLSESKMGKFWHPGYEEESTKWILTSVFFDQTNPKKRPGIYAPERISTSVSTSLPNWFFLTQSLREDSKSLSLLLVWAKDSLSRNRLIELIKTENADEIKGDVQLYEGNEDLKRLLWELSSRLTPEEIHRRIHGSRHQVRKVA